MCPSAREVLVEPPPASIFVGTDATFTWITDSDYNAIGGNFVTFEVVTTGPAPVPAPLIGRGLPILLAFGGILLGARLWERSKKGSVGTVIPHAAL